MGPNRFRTQREKREVTPFADEAAPQLPSEQIPAEWRKVEAPPNFTWVAQDELAGMGWPKSRDQVRKKESVLENSNKNVHTSYLACRFASSWSRALTT